MNYLNRAFALLMLISSGYLYSQDAYPDCITPETFEVPLNTDKTNELIYYQTADKYTYWYKIDAVEQTIVEYELGLIDNEDSYSLMIYHFNGKSFCNEMASLKPLSILSKNRLTVEKGSTYYLGVLHLNGYGCGHTLRISNGNQQLTYKAIQNECVEEAIETVVQQIEPDTVEAIPEVKIKPLPKVQQIKGVVINKNSQEKIEATISVSDLNGNFIQHLTSQLDKGFIMDCDNNNDLIVTIEKFGYELFRDTLTPGSNSFTLALNPIKVGEKIVMHKIYFHPNTYVLKEESKKELIKLNKFMLENKKYSFEIQGHTNGNRNIKRTKKYEHLGEEWNFKGTSKKLSKERAEKIKVYLVKNGVKESQLRTVGYGGDKMIIEKPRTMKQAMRNIRVEVIVVQ